MSRGVGFAFQGSASKQEGFDSIFKTIVKSLESGNMSTIERVPFSGEKEDKVVVLGRLQNQSIEWVEAELPDWHHAIYTVDDPDAPLHTAINKGNEANAYLTYIIEHYDRLPSIIAFIHGHHRSWHTDAAKLDNGRSLQTLKLDYVRKNGYANLRCLARPGCPSEIHPWRKDKDHRTELAFADAWQTMFNSSHVPEVIAVACCAQFAVSREQILKRSREEYIWYHKWLMDTDLEDEISGRVFEYLWHVIFGRDAVHCPPVDECYSNVYGIDSRVT
ncbi:hypothetical protein AAFC00_002086 [Neodothiora populina]